MGKGSGKYGYYGWQEFLSNRKDLLNEYDKALEKNRNHPVRTSHGEAGEAAIRKFLSTFLPQKYGVTSGYIIPDIICKEYKIYHFDVIIYDKINSPVLWINSDYDKSELGKKRAIPAHHVFSVIEVKASFNKKSLINASKKLSELNALAIYLPKEFTSTVIFFELKDHTIKADVLSELISNHIFKFIGGIVLRSNLNDEMTGLIDISDENKELFVEDIKPIVKDIEDLDIFRNEENNVEIKNGAGCAVASDLQGKLHFNKVYYSPFVSRNEQTIVIGWSYNHFTKYIIKLLGFLEGKNYKDSSTPMFGQVYESIPKKMAPLQSKTKVPGKAFLQLKIPKSKVNDSMHVVKKSGLEWIIELTIFIINTGEEDVVVSTDSFKNKLLLLKGQYAEHRADFRIEGCEDKTFQEIDFENKVKLGYRIVYYVEKKEREFFAIEKQIIFKDDKFRLVDLNSIQTN